MFRFHVYEYAGIECCNTKLYDQNFSEYLVGN